MSSGAWAHTSEPLLRVRDLTINLVSNRNPVVPVVSGVSFTVERAASLGLFGESGCGKTTVALALLGLLSPKRYRVSGSIRLNGRELLAMTDRQLQRVRGAEIAMVFQDPLLALNPVMRVRDQVSEAVRAHKGRRGAGMEALAGLGLSERHYNAYPHQLSGGERQRVALALALACNPALVIADEPFTALDAPRVVELTALFRELREKLGASLLLIEHSPSLLARVTDSALDLGGGSRGPGAESHGARAEVRGADTLSAAPALVPALGDVEEHGKRGLEPPILHAANLPWPPAPGPQTGDFLKVIGLGKRYAQASIFGRERDAHWAIHDVSLSLPKGGALALVGLSGSGKSTLARCLALYDRPTCGSVLLEGRSLWEASANQRQQLRAEIQLIFQQPGAALNPRFTAEEIIAEPLLIQKRGTAATRRKCARELMELTGLPPCLASKPALDFSGGERQRLAIARALALEPKLLILDESLSGLDVALQAQLLDLLADLRKRLGVTYILITHDLGVVSCIADQIAVMDSGIIVEHGEAAEVLARPRHPRTRELMGAVLALSAGARS